MIFSRRISFTIVIAVSTITMSLSLTRNVSAQHTVHSFRGRVEIVTGADFESIEIGDNLTPDTHIRIWRESSITVNCANEKPEMESVNRHATTRQWQDHIVRDICTPQDSPIDDNGLRDPNSDDVAPIYGVSDNSTPYVITPRGKVSTPTPDLSWKPVVGARYYDLKLVRADGEEFVFSTEEKGNISQIPYPFDEELQPPGLYLLIVTAKMEDSSNLSNVSSLNEQIHLFEENLNGEDEDSFRFQYVNNRENRNYRGFGFRYNNEEISLQEEPEILSDLQDEEKEIFRREIQLFRALQYYRQDFFSEAINILRTMKETPYVNYLRGLSSSKVGLVPESKYYYERSLRQSDVSSQVRINTLIGLAHVEILEARAVSSEISEIVDRVQNQIIPLRDELDLDSYVRARVTWRIGRLYLRLAQLEHVEEAPSQEFHQEARNFLTDAKDQFGEILIQQEEGQDTGGIEEAVNDIIKEIYRDLEHLQRILGE